MGEPIEVRLDWYEHYLAGKVGVHRHTEAIRRKLRRGNKGKKHSLVAHYEGALGEIAVAKAANRYWGGTVNVGKKVSDVGNFIEVRCREGHDKDLILRENDPDGRVMVLVTWEPDDMLLFKVWGWVYTEKGKKEEYKSNPGGYGTCYLIPANKLNKMEDLPHEYA